MKITVLMGGASSERDVSLASGLRIVEALRSRGHTVSVVDPAKGVINESEEHELRARKVGTAPPSLEELASFSEGSLIHNLLSLPEIKNADVVFLALHGGQGEDGTIQALLDMGKVRYTGSGPMASAIAMDKDISKILFRAADVQTADWIMAPANAKIDTKAVEQKLGVPVIVKPSKQGSTVGLTVVKKIEDLQSAVDTAFRYDNEVMIERFIPGRELTVGVLGDIALPVGEIKPKHEIYDYECKYTAGMATEEFPAQIPDKVAKKAQQQALAAFRALKLRGYARIDFRMMDGGNGGDNDELYCLEANTLPGMTDLSLIPQGAAAMGINFPALCEKIVKLAVE